MEKFECIETTEQNKINIDYIFFNVTKSIKLYKVPRQMQRTTNDN